MLKWTKTEGEFSYKAFSDSGEFYLRKNQNGLGGWILEMRRGGVPTVCGYHARLLTEIKQIAEMLAKGMPAPDSDKNSPDSFGASAGRSKKIAPKRQPAIRTTVEVTEYEVEVQDYSPEATRKGQVVVYFLFNSETESQIVGEENDPQSDALIYRTKITLQSDDLRVVIYTDGLVEAGLRGDITFISPRADDQATSDLRLVK
jgi:hypothetical protein